MHNDPTTGYAGWEWLELGAGEDRTVRNLSAAFNRVVHMEGGPSMELAIRKAALTITPAEVRSGAYHTLADGQPFYHCRISTTDHDAGINTILMLAQVLGVQGGVSVIMDEKTEVVFDRRALGDLAIIPPAAGHAVRMLKVR